MCILGPSCLVEGAMPVLVTPYDSEKERMRAVTTTHCGTQQLQGLQTFSEGDADLSLEEFIITKHFYHKLSYSN